MIGGSGAADDQVGVISRSGPDPDVGMQVGQLVRLANDEPVWTPLGARVHLLHRC